MTLKNDIEKLSITNKDDIMFILKTNDEQITEVNDCFFFDIKKLKKKTTDDFKNLIKNFMKIDINSSNESTNDTNDKEKKTNTVDDKYSVFFENVNDKTLPEVVINDDNSKKNIFNDNLSKDNDNLSKDNNNSGFDKVTDNQQSDTSITIVNKLATEYNNDYTKINDKHSTLVKFMNARKRFIRNTETLILKNENNLKKDKYIY